jgi:UrcA family protein
MRITAIFTAAAAAIALAAGPTLAAGAESPVAGQVTVQLGDLDLNSAPGAHAAVARLTRAAAEACGDQPGVSPELIWMSDSYRLCRSAALATAVSKIHTAAVEVAFAEVRGQTVRLARR